MVAYCHFKATSTLVEPESEKNICVKFSGKNLLKRSATFSAGLWVKPAKIIWCSFSASFE